MFCTNCGTKIEDEHKFCKNCGAGTGKEGQEGGILGEETEVSNNSNVIPQAKIQLSKIEEGLRSGRWNAFLVDGADYNAYIYQGEQLVKGLLSDFSKAKKEQQARALQRQAKLLQSRVVEVDGAYFKRMATKPDKELRHIIWVNPKNLESAAKGNTAKLKELIDAEKIESGLTVGTFPVRMGKGSGVLFVTTKGICIMYTTEDGNMSTKLPFVLARALGPAGPIAVGLAAVAGHAIAGRISNYVFNKNQREVIDLAKNFPPSLLTRCFGLGDSAFVPYGQANMFVYCRGDNGVGTAVLTYANAKAIPLEVDNRTLDEIVALLSVSSPEEWVIKNANVEYGLVQSKETASAPSDPAEARAGRFWKPTVVYSCKKCGKEVPEDHAGLCSECE